MSWVYFQVLKPFGSAERHKKEESNDNCYMCMGNGIMTHKTLYVIEFASSKLVLNFCKNCTEKRIHLIPLGKSNKLNFIQKRNYYLFK